MEDEESKISENIKENWSVYFSSFLYQVRKGQNSPDLNKQNYLIILFMLKLTIFFKKTGRLFSFISLTGLCVLLLLLLPYKSFASSCQKVNETVVVACSYHCDNFYQRSLKRAAKELGVQLKLKNLYKLKKPYEELSRIDALLIPGGADIHPKFYWNQVSDELKNYTKKNIHLVNFSEEGKRRDYYEYNLMQLYLRENQFSELPLLGICRGMQMMAVSQGIPLYLDIKKELGIRNRYIKFDRIYVVNDSRHLPNDFSLIQEILSPQLNFRGYKYHHQGIRVPYFMENKEKYSSSFITSYSHQGRIAESFEFKNRVALGVQFHPEKSFPKVSKPIFKWLIEKACIYKMKRK